MAESADYGLLGGTQNVAQVMQKNAAAGQALQAGQLDQASKANIYATQVISAATSTGNQQLYDSAKAHLQQMGIDPSPWAPDVATAKEQAQAARLAQSPLGPLINAATKLDANQIAANTAAGKSTGNPNANTMALMPGAINSVVPGAGGLYTPQAPAGGPSTLPPPLPGATPPAQGQPAAAPSAQVGGLPLQVAPSAQPIDANGSTANQFVAPPRDPSQTQAAYQQSVSDARAAWEASPAVKAAQTSATKTADVTGGEAGEALKLYNKMSSSLPMISDRFSKMRAATNDASYGLAEMTGVGPALANTAMGSQKTADANAMLDQAGSQQILGELGPMLAQSGARANKFLETISAAASGYNKAAPPATKQLIINGLEDNYLATLKTNADEARAAGQPVPPAAEIDAQIAAIKAQRPPVDGAPATAAAPVYNPGQILDSPTLGKVVFKGGDPTDKSNYIPVGK